MTNLAQLLPQESPTVKAIFAHYKRVGDAEQARGYLGASIIGHSCERYLWYTFRYCCRPEFDGRMYRLFATGNLEEARFAADLRDIGCEVHDLDETGQQFAVSAIGGHFSGHMDGCALGIPEAPKTWHVTEYKTHNARSFTKLKKEGVKAAKPQHYAQVQVYMHLTGMTRALYLARNKDTDDLHAERIRYDKEGAEALMARAERIITSATPPERIATRPDYYECSWCDAHRICWGDPAGPALPIPAISCRQCCHATPKLDGHARWQCEKHGRSLSPTDQERACDDHLTLPGLISSADPVDYGRDKDGHDFILFRNDVWDEWRCGRGNDAFSTKELMVLPAMRLTNPLIDRAKELFGATVAGYYPDDILTRYPEGDSRIVWRGPAGELVAIWKGKYGEDLASLAPLARYNGFDYRAAEFSGGRVAIAWTSMKQVAPSAATTRPGPKVINWRLQYYNAEIREGVE